MRKWALFAFMLTLLIITPISSPRAQDEIDLLDESGFENSRRSAVVFLHDDHNDLAQIDECSECHHVYEDGVKLEDESSEDQKCSDCHGQKPSGAMPGLRAAFHLNCKGCHMKMKKGPVMCGQCHRR